MRAWPPICATPVKQELPFISIGRIESGKFEARLTKRLARFRLSTGVRSRLWLQDGFVVDKGRRGALVPDLADIAIIQVVTVYTVLVDASLR